MKVKVEEEQCYRCLKWFKRLSKHYCDIAKSPIEQEEEAAIGSHKYTYEYEDDFE